MSGPGEGAPAGQSSKTPAPARPAAKSSKTPAPARPAAKSSGTSAASESAAPLVEVQDLDVLFRTPQGEVRAVDGVSFAVRAGATLGLAGESGSGKSVTALSIPRLVPTPPGVYGGRSRIRFGGRELLRAPPRQMRAIRGAEIGVVFQEPMTALNPYHRVGDQVAEALLLHGDMGPGQARERTAELLELVRIDQPLRRMRAYPHEISGGQAQRVLIAMAIANRPRLLIADEPTTALDIAVQAGILDLLGELREQLGMTLIFISHDLGVVRAVADDICVMRRGRIVEAGPCEQVLGSPSHAYTRDLVAAIPRGRPKPSRPAGQDAPMLQVQGLQVRYAGASLWGLGRARGFQALRDIDFRLDRGQTLGVVGESGSGKSTLAHALVDLVPSSGGIAWHGRQLAGMDAAERLRLKRDMQIVFQDPYGSLSPRMRVEEIVSEPLRVHEPQLSAGQRAERVAELLAEVQMDPAAVRFRYPHEFSGGQRQRIAIARSLAVRPRLLILDEPTSALDLSVQARVLELLQQLRERHGLAYLFISHNLDVVRVLCERVMVLRGGRVLEEGPTDQVLSEPRDPYTRELLQAASRFRLGGEAA